MIVVIYDVSNIQMLLIVVWHVKIYDGSILTSLEFEYPIQKNFKFAVIRIVGL